MNNLERFKAGEIVLHTPTQELFDRLMQWCEIQGMTWGGDKATVRQSRWIGWYQDQTCISWGGYSTLYYASYDYYQRNHNTIVTLTNKDFEEEHQMTKEDLKVGMVVELRRGDKHLVINSYGYPCIDNKSNPSEYLNMKYIDNSLLNSGQCGDACDITKVYTTSDLVSILEGNYDSLELIWSRENPEVTAMKANVAKMEAELESMKENLRKMEEM